MGLQFVSVHLFMDVNYPMLIDDCKVELHEVMVPPLEEVVSRPHLWWKVY